MVGSLEDELVSDSSACAMQERSRRLMMLMIVLTVLQLATQINRTRLSKGVVWFTKSDRAFDPQPGTKPLDFSILLLFSDQG